MQYVWYVTAVLPTIVMDTVQLNIVLFSDKWLHPSENWLVTAYKST